MEKYKIVLCLCLLMGLTSSGWSTVAWWPFEEGSGTTTADIINGLDGTLVNGATFTTGQHRNYAVLLDGVNDYVSVPYDPMLNPGTSDFTYTLWIKNNVAGKRVFLLNQRDTSGSFIGLEWLSDNRIRCQNKSYAAYQNTAYNTTSLSANTWIHIAAVIKRGGPVKIYINGVDDTSGTPTAGTDNLIAVADFHVGRWSGGDGYYVDGAVDDVRFYKRALSAEEIQAVIDDSIVLVTEPIPSDGASNIDPAGPELKWTAPTAPAGEPYTYDVYVTPEGGSEIQVGSNLTVAECTPSPELDYAKRYTWRVDSTGSDSVVTTGPTWEFSTSGLVGGHLPIDNTDGVPVDIQLSWDTDSAATEYDVYFGDDPNDVRDAGTGDVEYMGRISETAYDIAGLDPNSTHYWRVAAVNGTTVLGTGDVLGFTTLVSRVHWTMDDSGTTVTDSIGSNDGSLVNDPNWVQGILNGALQLDGVDQYVDIPDSDDFIITDAGITYSFFIKRDVAARSFPLSQRAADGSTLINVDLAETGQLVLALRGPLAGGDLSTTFDYALSLGAWHHVVISYNRIYLDQSKIYVDGQEAEINVNTLTSNPGEINIDAPMNIGRWGGGAFYFFDGSLDEIKVFNGPLTADQVMALYEESELAKYPVPADDEEGVAASGLTLSWTPGANSPVSHDVYFSETPDFTGVTPVSRTTPDYTPSGLVVDTDYYWYVNEVYSDHTVPGPVWTFKTTPPIASAPDPENGETGVAGNKVLTWTAGDGFDAGSGDTHEVYIAAGTTEADLPGTPTATVTSESFGPDLAFDTDYVWRVDEVIGGTTYTGDLWAFSTSVAICDPPLTGDLNGDCVINLTDFSILAQDWLECTLTNGDCP